LLKQEMACDINAGNLIATKADLKTLETEPNVTKELTKLTGTGISSTKSQFDSNSKKSGNGDLIVN
jgi:hypothetical protein